ncbi:hypothetical protein C8A03DRAFT_39059 [Achaetomium macrosporum]|uniref:Cell wall protein PhiA n=1 Tax=Achaetomium macrosporum TaxID=79813 RepID=A0AAN7C184_9PEZI|nr:hypothetical protein C8A03DRAFT_39059 [Achaetomium macrosporum]
MQLNAVLLSLFAAAASAAPAGDERKFGIMALRSASPIHFAPAKATQGKLVFNLPDSKMDAQCTDGSKGEKGAIFTLKDGELYLYGKDQVQQIYVNRSGMGQGVLGYFNKDTSNPPRNSELKGWAVDATENLTFDGTGLLACPGGDDAFYIWASGVDKPAGIEGCLPFSARTVTQNDAAECTYSTRE